jgi:hypothetical protein
MYEAKDTVDAPLHVITTVFNPERYKSRYKLLERFEKMVRSAGATLTIVEVAFGERQHVEPYVAAKVQSGGIPTKVITLRTRSEIWLKENALNLGLAAVPPDAKYIAFVDADVAFARPNWVWETVQQLQHFDVVQMFGEAIDLDPDHERLAIHKGFVWSEQHGAPRPAKGDGYYYYPQSTQKDGIVFWHPGYAWGWRRAALDEVGGLLDFAVLGSADNHMAKALLGRVLESVHPGVSPAYRAALLQWQSHALRLKHNVGYVSGELIHYWHGKKGKRGYRSRWQILVENRFDPALDLKKDWQGLWQLTDRNPKLRDAIRNYFRSRSEDSIDV